MSHLAFMSQLSVTEGENVRKTLRVVWMRPKLQRHPAIGRLGLGGYQGEAVCSYASKVEQLAGPPQLPDYPTPHT